jgi:hypothetical protein
MIAFASGILGRPARANSCSSSCFAKKPIGMVLTLRGVVEAFEDGEMTLKLEQWQSELTSCADTFA